MTALTALKPADGIQHEGPTDPGVDVVGARLNDTYRNSLSYELFTCIRATFGQQIWVGSQGTQSILSFDHPDLVAAYTMDAVSGATLTDETGTYDGTITGAVQVAGQIGNALSFDGTDDYTSHGATLSNAEMGGANATFAYSCWVKFPNTGANQVVAAKYGDGAQSENKRGFRYEINAAGYPQFGWYSNDAGSNFYFIRASNLVNDDAWHHVVMMYDGSQAMGSRLTFYVDGAASASVYVAGSGTFDINTNDALFSLGAFIGASGTNPTNRSSGDLDQFRLFDRQLTATEIQELYQEGARPITSFDNLSLVAAYTMDNISGATLVDESANGNDGTITGAVQVAGKIGNALSFDGVDDNISGYLNTDTTGAISLWVKRTATGIITLVGKANPSIDTEALLFQLGDTSEVRVADVRSGGAANIIVSTGSALPVSDTFNHLVFQTNGTAFDAWLNGAQLTLTASVGSDLGSWFGDLPNSAARNVQFSVADIFGGAIFYQSNIDQFRQFNRALSSAEIAELYNAGAGA